MVGVFRGKEKEYLEAVGKQKETFPRLFFCKTAFYLVLWYNLLYNGDLKGRLDKK